MSVILLILKITGIVILSIIGIALLLILAIVFYPVGYHLMGRYEEEQQIKVKLHWLFYLVYFRFQMINGEKKATLYLFGIPKQIYPGVEKKKRNKSHKKCEKKQDEIYCEKQSEETIQENVNAPDMRTPDTMEVVPETASHMDVAEKESPQAESKKKFLPGRLFEKMKHIFHKVKKFIGGLPEKAKKLYANIKNWKEIISDEANKVSVKLVWTELRYILSHYKPRRLKADIRYGFEDPSMTGKSLAVISMMPFLYKKKVQIVPDFEAEKIFIQGNLEGRGRIRLFHLLRSGMHIWKDNNIRKLMRRLRK